ncbi:MAG TPA: TlpA disulfide reductase family protein [Candidatus Acidoferrales bacterium]|nr:TlpA disulfide reductase family protein [Candidatus Acidoferrales bacterium]
MKKEADPEEELQKALDNAGNDSAALARNLRAYLQKFPDAPRKPGVYRALVEACQQIRDNACALDFAERLIAVRPDDSQMMLLAVNLLEDRGDEASLARAAGYVTRVLDRVEKASPDERPARESVADWQDGQAQLRTALYYIRGQSENSRHDYDAAVKDLQTSYSIRPNALAARMLGEIAERRRDSAAAIEEYTLAFALPESGPAGQVDRREVRRKLGNVWRQVHGSEDGLGEAILAAYDRVGSAPADAQLSPAARNRDAKELYSFVVRRLDGTPLPLAPVKGRVAVLSFWATWCGPCRELEPMFDQVARNFTGNPEVAFFAINTDEDQTLVPPFVAHEKWDVPVFYADGLDGFMNVKTLPTVLVIGRSGEIVYRTNGLSTDGFSESLSAAIQSALASARKSP